MDNVIIRPFKPSGEVFAPPSKSDAHRAIICAALSRGKCTVSPIALSNDIKATIQCVEALGAKTEINGSILTVDGTEMFKNKKGRRNTISATSLSFVSLVIQPHKKIVNTVLEKKLFFDFFKYFFEIPIDIVGKALYKGVTY